MTSPAEPIERPEDPAGRAELLRSWALEEGFDRAGVARLEPSQQFDAFTGWVERGDHASMEWIGRRTERRADPRTILPGARTALCVALQYWPLEVDTMDEGDGAESVREPEAEGDLWPGVARYARGRDYHDIMTKALRRLGRRIEDSFPGATTRSYVDTGPILERELAARAGLGVQGKNTNLLDRAWGSYFLLGEVLLTLDLTPDEPIADACGRCTRCLDHCPTGALPAPYRLDSRRCISFWTIEHRGDLPDEAKEMVGEWVFGCDVCQEVCPWNYKAAAGRHPQLRLPEERRTLDLAGLLGLERDDYVRRFTKSPMKRAKLEGLKRNAAVVMGNRGDAAYVEPLAAALADESQVVRRHAAWSLGRIGGMQAADALRAALRADTDPAHEPDTVAEIERALAAIGSR